MTFLCMFIHDYDVFFYCRKRSAILHFRKLQQTKIFVSEMLFKTSNICCFLRFLEIKEYFLESWVTRKMLLSYFCEHSFKIKKNFPLFTMHLWSEERKLNINTSRKTSFFLSPYYYC